MKVKIFPGKMKRFRRLWPAGALFLFVHVLLISIAPAEARLAERKNVLILNSYHEGFKWTDDITRGVIAALEPVHGETRIFIEYMNTKWVKDDLYFQQLRQILKHKYARTRFDLIISSDNDAFDFLRQYRDEVFGKVPVVFNGVNYFKQGDLAGTALFTGVSETADLRESLELALRLHPSVKRVFVINDLGISGRLVKDELEKLAPNFQGRARFEYENSADLEKILKDVESLSPDTLIFYTFYYGDPARTPYENSECIFLISRHARVPIYGAWDFNLGYGIVGGKLTSGYDQGITSGRMGLRILKGERVGNIPPLLRSRTRYMFDYRQMERFGIRKSALPEGSIVINGPKTFHEIPNALIWATLCGIASLGVVIFMLIYANRQRERSEKALQKAYDGLEQRVEERTAELAETVRELRFTQFAVDRSVYQAFWLTSDGRFFYVNDAACDSLGYTRDELLTMSVPEINPTCPPDEFPPYWRMLIEKGTYTFETCHRARDGRVFPVEIRSNLLIYDGKEFCCSFVTDITERKRAEEERRKSEENFSIIFQATPDLIAITRAVDGTILEVNKAFSRLLGYSRPEAIGNSTEELSIWADPADRARWMAALEATGQVDECETTLRRKDGSLVTCVSTARPLDFGGEKCVLSVVRDITERKKAEEALLLSQFCIDKAGIGIFGIDPTTAAILSSNEYACKSLGYSREELCGLTVFDIGPEITPERILDIEGELNEKGSVTHYSTHRRKDGATYPVEVTANHLYFHGERFVISFFRDITERKRAEEALRDSEARLKMAMDLARLVQWEYDVESGMFTFDDQFYALYCTTAEQEGGVLMSAKDYARRFIPPEESALVAGGIAEVLAKSSNQLEHRIIRADGEERHIVVRGESARNETGRIVKIRGVNQDITERKRAEEQLRKSEIEQRKLARDLAQKNNFLRTLIDAMPDLIFYKDCNRVYLGCNKAFETFAGQREKDLVGLSDFDIFSREVAVAFRETDLEILSTEESRRYEEWIDYPDGRRVLLETLKTPFFDLDGEILGVVGVSRDITERKKMEEELLLSHFCINRAGIGIYQSDETGTIYRVNEQACKSLGYTREELCALSVLDLDPEITKEKMLELKEILDKRGLVTIDSTHRRKDGTTFPVEIIINSLDFKGKRYDISFVKDITERRQAEEALRESESRVRRKLESILDPEGDTGDLELVDILDAPQIQALMEDLYRITGLKMSIIDLKGQVLVDVGWQPICAKYHRTHPETLKRCHESDMELTVGIPQGEFRTYRCRNNMWHIVTPIIVGGRHMANLFMGQFFFVDEKIDYDLFRSQARRYGFPEEEYIAALEAVPRLSEELVNLGKAVFLGLTDMFSKLSYANIKLAHSVAERDRLTATLRESEALLKLAMDLAKMGAWEYDTGTGLFSFDDQFYALYGTTVEREGGPLMPAEVYARKFIPPEESSVVADGIEHMRANPYLQVEHRIIRADGEERFIIVRGEAVFDQEGRFVKIRGANQDITERKLAEEAIRESRAKYQALVDSFDGFIYICSQDYRVEFMNRKLIERTGYDATGELCFKMMHDRDSVCPWCVNERVFAGETVHWEMFSPKDNRWYYVVNVPIRHADGSMSKQSMIIDITGRKLFEEEIQRQKQLLQDLNDTLENRVEEEVAKNREKDIMLIQQNRQAALGEMLDHIAHQWKQPLNSISLIVQDMGDTSSDGELTDELVRETACKITALLDHMAQTIDIFRGFYRPDKEKKVFSVKDAIGQALTFISPAFRYHSIAVELDVDPGLTAHGYPKEYAQVLLNILANARDALKARETEKPRVIIRAFAEGTKTVVTIADNAGGIPEAIMGKIFDFYFTTNEAGGGTGIGLYMSRNIIEKNMGGRLRAENTDDGAQFRIETFPT